MGIAVTVKKYLRSKSISFEVQQHAYAEGSFNTASVAQIPYRNLAKAVVFRDEDFYYTMAVLPSPYKVRRHTLNQIFDRRLELADEDELAHLFVDCAPGAVPALGQAYGINVIWDDQLLDVDDIWMEAGDHQHLIHMNKEEFKTLMGDYMHEVFSLELPQQNRHKPNPCKKKVNNRSGM